jgi:2-polyprenyl-6-methoxyphenol hydroxylase-like FAD-dependent oxidoreductase
MDDIIIVGAGIGGLTLGLALHAAKIPCRIFESAAEIRPIGVGINLLPHATKELAALGLEADLARVGIATEDATFFNRFGQFLFRAARTRRGLPASAILDPSRRSADALARCL